MAKAEITVKAVAELDDESKQLLRDLRDRLRPARAGVQRQALAVVLDILDGWIEVAQHNHYALEHGGRENVGEECWRRFSPGDIRNMINCAAHKLGIDEFPYPIVPKEDTE